MAHLWQYENNHWSPLPLNGSKLSLVEGGVLVPLAPDANASSDAWVLLASPGTGVRVNGLSLSLGIRCLRDRDEIGAREARYFFSTERLVRVEPFSGAHGEAICARCRKPLEPGKPSVRCPGCGTWCHQREDSACWLYSETCPLCDNPTSLDAGYRWEPTL